MLSIIEGAVICSFFLSSPFLLGFLYLLCTKRPKVVDEHETAYQYDAPVIYRPPPPLVDYENLSGPDLERASRRARKRREAFIDDLDFCESEIV